MSSSTTTRSGSITPGTDTSHSPCSRRVSWPFSRTDTTRKRGLAPDRGDTTPPTTATWEPTHDQTAHDQTAHPHQVATAPPPLRRRIRLTLAEIRRLFNVRDQAKHAIHTAMRWSTYGREHQADARKRHFRRRLKIQYLVL